MSALHPLIIPTRQHTINHRLGYDKTEFQVDGVAGDEVQITLGNDGVKDPPLFIMLLTSDNNRVFLDPFGSGWSRTLTLQTDGPHTITLVAQPSFAGVTEITADGTAYLTTFYDFVEAVSHMPNVTRIDAPIDFQDPGPMPEYDPDTGSFDSPPIWPDGLTYLRHAGSGVMRWAAEGLQEYFGTINYLMPNGIPKNEWNEFPESLVLIQKASFVHLDSPRDISRGADPSLKVLRFVAAIVDTEHLTPYVPIEEMDSAALGGNFELTLKGAPTTLHSIIHNGRLQNNGYSSGDLRAINEELALDYYYGSFGEPSVDYLWDSVSVQYFKNLETWGKDRFVPITANAGGRAYTIAGERNGDPTTWGNKDSGTRHGSLLAFEDAINNGVAFKSPKIYSHRCIGTDARMMSFHGNDSLWAVMTTLRDEGFVIPMYQVQRLPLEVVNSTTIKVVVSSDSARGYVRKNGDVVQFQLSAHLSETDDTYPSNQAWVDWLTAGSGLVRITNDDQVDERYGPTDTNPISSMTVTENTDGDFECEITLSQPTSAQTGDSFIFGNELIHPDA